MDNNYNYLQNSNYEKALNLKEEYVLPVRVSYNNNFSHKSFITYTEFNNIIKNGRFKNAPSILPCTSKLPDIESQYDKLERLDIKGLANTNLNLVFAFTVDNHALSIKLVHFRIFLHAIQLKENAFLPSTWYNLFFGINFGLNDISEIMTSHYKPFNTDKNLNVETIDTNKINKLSNRMRIVSLSAWAFVICAMCNIIFLMVNKVYKTNTIFFTIMLLCTIIAYVMLYFMPVRIDVLFLQESIIIVVILLTILYVNGFINLTA